MIVLYFFFFAKRDDCNVATKPIYVDFLYKKNQSNERKKRVYFNMSMNLNEKTFKHEINIGR